MRMGFGVRLFAISGLLLALVVSCSLAVAQGEQAPVLGWQFMPVEGAVYGSAMSDDGASVVAVIGYGFEPGGAVVSLDAETGEMRWRVDVDEAPSSNPIVTNDVVYAGIGSLVTGRSAVYAFELATGSRLWRTDISNSKLPATPVDGVALGGSMLVVNRADGVVLGLGAATGKLQWERQLKKPPRGAPAVVGDAVFVSTGFDGATIHALDLATGESRWSTDEPENPVTGPAVADGMLYVGFTSGDLVAYDASTGDERWRAAVGLRSESAPPYPGLPVVRDGVVFITSNGFDGAATEAYDAVTGARLWIAPAGDFSGSAPAPIEGIVVVGSDTGDLIGFDIATGAESWRVAVPNAVDIDLDQASPPSIGNGWLVVRDDEGGVVGFEWPPDPAAR